MIIEGLLETHDDMPLVIIRAEATSGEAVELNIPIDLYITLHAIIERIGFEGAFLLACIGAGFAKAETVSHEQQERIQIIFSAIEQQKLDEQWKDPYDALVSCTYHMLRDRRMTHEQAAMVASRITGKEVGANSWRMRVDRWAAKRGLPKVEFYKRRES